MSEGAFADSSLMPWELDPRELDMGVEVEMEHTSDEEIALKIAMDHLAEDAKYYTKLKRAKL